MFASVTPTHPYSFSSEPEAGAGCGNSARPDLCGGAEQSASLPRPFGENGLVLTSFGSHSYAAAQAVLSQPDAKIVVVGSAVPDGLYDRFGLARYLPDGGADDSFGTHGVVTTVIGSNHAIPHAMVLQRDGKIVVAGQIYDPFFEVTLARYNADGSLDPSFGTAGIVTGVSVPRQK